jgi:hypothetical protein
MNNDRKIILAIAVYAAVMTMVFHAMDTSALSDALSILGLSLLLSFGR